MACLPHAEYPSLLGGLDTTQHEHGQAAIDACRPRRISRLPPTEHPASHSAPARPREQAWSGLLTCFPAWFPGGGGLRLVCLPGFREGSSHGVGWCVEGISGPCSARIPRSRSGKKGQLLVPGSLGGHGRLPPAISSSPQRRFSESAAVGGGGGGSRCYPVPGRASMLRPGPTLATQVRTRERTLSLLAARFGLGPGQGRARKISVTRKRKTSLHRKPGTFSPLSCMCVHAFGFRDRTG